MIHTKIQLVNISHYHNGLVFALKIPFLYTKQMDDKVEKQNYPSNIPSIKNDQLITIQ